MKRLTSSEIQVFVSAPYFDPSIILKRDSSYPKISVVTPSYNQGEFLERTILSVLNQNYPNLEFIIIDGKSTDQSIEIIRKYEKYLAYWVSEPDQGQSEAINKGFKRISGDIIGWQNSDDTYNPGAFLKAIEAFSRHPESGVIFGSFYLINKNDEIMRECNFRPFNKWDYLYVSSNVTNQSAFFSKAILEKTGLMEVRYRYTMDVDYWMRAADRGRFTYVNEFFGNLRFHPRSKTVTSLFTPEWQNSLNEIRLKNGLKVNPKKPWETQFRFMKAIYKCRRLYYYLAQGNFRHLWKRLTHTLDEAQI